MCDLQTYRVEVTITFEGHKIGTFNMLAEALTKAHLLRGLYTGISIHDMMHPNNIANTMIGRQREIFVLNALWAGGSYEEFDVSYERGWWDHEGYVIDGELYTLDAMAEIAQALNVIEPYLELLVAEESK